MEPCVDKKDTSKKRRNKIIQCERKDRFAMSKARKSWIFQNGLSFQKIYAPEMQKPPFADGVNSLSTTPGATGKVRLLWGICISRHCYICFVCLWLFGSNGNSFRHAFQLYLLYQRKGGRKGMAAKSKYLNFPIEAADHRKLKLLCLHRDCTLKSILQEIVHSYVENAPEFKKEES